MYSKRTNVFSFTIWFRRRSIWPSSYTYAAWRNLFQYYNILLLRCHFLWMTVAFTKCTHGRPGSEHNQRKEEEKSYSFHVNSFHFYPYICVFLLRSSVHYDYEMPCLHTSRTALPFISEIPFFLWHDFRLSPMSSSPIYTMLPKHMENILRHDRFRKGWSLLRAHWTGSLEKKM